jgi:hypothetical protein
MALELEGRIARKLNVQTGTSTRGAWSKQEFIFEYQEGNFPSQICMNVWGEDKVRELDKYQVGDKVKISFNLSSREFNGRWYTDVRAWRIEPAGGVQQHVSQQNAPAVMTQTPPQMDAAPTPSLDDLPGEDDDLPF